MEPRFLCPSQAELAVLGSLFPLRTPVELRGVNRWESERDPGPPHWLLL